MIHRETTTEHKGLFKELDGISPTGQQVLTKMEGFFSTLLQLKGKEYHLKGQGANFTLKSHLLIRKP